MFFREIFQLICDFSESNIVMKKNLSILGLLFLGLIAPSQNQRTSRRPFKFSLPSDVSETIDQRYLDVSGNRDIDSSGYITRNIAEERREIGEARPMCDEERKSLNIRELVSLKNPNFLPAPIDLDLRKYNLLPRKIDVIKCVKRSQDNMESGAICRQENCRERKVDIGVFGRMKNETGNVWEFVGTLTAVPVACECFVRWKPEKCSRSLDILSDY